MKFIWCVRLIPCQADSLTFILGIPLQAAKQELYYPPWALGLLIGLIVLAALPIPVMFFWQLLIENLAQRNSWPCLAAVPVPTEEKEEEEEDKEEEEKETPADPDNQGNGYLLVQTEDKQD